MVFRATGLLVESPLALIQPAPGWPRSEIPREDMTVVLTAGGSLVIPHVSPTVRTRLGITVSRETFCRHCTTGCLSPGGTARTRATSRRRVSRSHTCQPREGGINPGQRTAGERFSSAEGTWAARPPRSPDCGGSTREPASDVRAQALRWPLGSRRDRGCEARFPCHVERQSEAQTRSSV